MFGWKCEVMEILQGFFKLTYSILFEVFVFVNSKLCHLERCLKVPTRISLWQNFKLQFKKIRREIHIPNTFPVTSRPI